MSEAGRPDPQLQRRAAKRTAVVLGVFALALFTATIWSLMHASP